MAKKKKGLQSSDYLVGGIAALLIGKFLFFSKMSRTEAINVLRAAGHTGITDTPDWTDNYLIAWATAVRKKSPTFKLNNNLYDTLTGRKI